MQVICHERVYQRHDKCKCTECPDVRKLVIKRGAMFFGDDPLSEIFDSSGQLLGHRVVLKAKSKILSM